jgi:hypothetical protein
MTPDQAYTPGQLTLNVLEREYLGEDCCSSVCRAEPIEPSYRKSYRLTADCLVYFYCSYPSLDRFKN